PYDPQKYLITIHARNPPHRTLPEHVTIPDIFSTQHLKKPQMSSCSYGGPFGRPSLVHGWTGDSDLPGWDALVSPILREIVPKERCSLRNRHQSGNIWRMSRAFFVSGVSGPLHWKGDFEQFTHSREPFWLVGRPFS
ncbi:MAG: hypothetical protein ABGZ53_01965, partial [Fuerstiella sp.]